MRTKTSSGACGSVLLALLLAFVPQAGASTGDEVDRCPVRLNDVYVRVNAGRIQSSPDGKFWTDRPVAIRTFMRGVTSGNGMLVAVGGSYVEPPGVIFTSRDGHNWVRRQMSDHPILYAVAYGRERFVAVGDGGVILVSTNGTRWQRQDSGTTALLATVAFGNELFVAGGESGTVLVSTNGLIWKSCPLASSHYIGSISFRNGSFAIRVPGANLIAENARDWRTQESVMPESLLAR